MKTMLRFQADDKRETATSKSEVSGGDKANGEESEAAQREISSLKVQHRVIPGYGLHFSLRWTTFDRNGAIVLRRLTACIPLPSSFLGL